MRAILKPTAALLLLLGGLLLLVACGGDDGGDEATGANDDTTQESTDVGNSDDESDSPDESSDDEEALGDDLTDAQRDAKCEAALAAANAEAGTSLERDEILGELCTVVDPETAQTFAFEFQVPLELNNVCEAIADGEAPQSMGPDGEVVDTPLGPAARLTSGEGENSNVFNICDDDGLFYFALVGGFDDDEAVALAGIAAAMEA